ncbi:MAG: thiol-disulfide isomerase/thioredoxin [Flavobacteriales bacterium]|jgi:thiol-disulfide isomerase/thioredoxin
MKQIVLTLFSLFALLGCSNADASKTQAESVAAVQETQDVAETTAVSLISGISEKNAGDKVGPIRLHGKVKGAREGMTLYLGETEGKNDQITDSTTIKAGAYDFGVNEFHRGFYMLSFDANNKVALIMNPDEQEVEVDFNSTILDAAPVAIVSKENEGWVAYFLLEKKLDNEVRNLRRSRSQSSFKERIDQQIEAKEVEKRSAQDAAIQKYPDTFLAKYLTWYNSPYLSEKGKYWDDIDFTDVSIIRTPVLPNRVQEFMRTHSGGEDQGFYNCIDMVKSKSEVNSKVLEFALYTMLDGFYQSGMEDVSQYILDAYILDEDCSADLSDVIKQRAQGIINLQIGKTPPNFNIESLAHGNIELAKEVKKNEYTLVMFWASWCHKCEQEIPVLKGVYEEYKDKGFGVIGVSVDKTRGAWERAVEENDVSWPNVSQLLMWESPVAQDYKVTQTPSLFLLDKDMRIVDKPSRIFQVEALLKSKLK